MIFAIPYLFVVKVGLRKNFTTVKRKRPSIGIFKKTSIVPAREKDICQ